MTLTLNSLDIEYKELVEEAAMKEECLDIPNSTLEHAILVQTKLIENTKRNLSILTGGACEINQPEIKTSLMIIARRLRNQTQSPKPRNRLFPYLGRYKTKEAIPLKGIRIIMYNNETEESRDFCNFFRDYPDVIQIKRYKPREDVGHFLVSDSGGYRREDRHKDKDLIDYNIKATANFNNPNISSMLSDFFDKCWDKLKR